MRRGSLLIVDDNKNVRSALSILLDDYFEQLTLLSSPGNLISTLREKNPDVVLLDMNFSAGINTGNEGLFWLSEVKRINPELPIVLFTAYADIDLAIKALKDGAFDFIVKPWDNAKLLATLQAALAISQSRKEVKRLREKENILNHELDKGEEICWGTSSKMQEVLRIINKVAKTDANVLITGENGTGKEVVAKMIHRQSLRSNETKVTVDMGAITESLFESELFGHLKGSFTDAKTDRAGKFEAANGGTLFLDEIGNLSYTLQGKLLTVLESRNVVRVGSNTPIPVDIRLISATNKDLYQQVKDGAFREDLLYRINTIEIAVPPLRERREDIALLARFFVGKFAKKYGKPQLTLSNKAVDKLETYRWPGNIRELKHAIERAVILSEGAELTISDFFLNTIEDKVEMLDSMSLDDMELILIKKAIESNNGKLSAAANQLGISRPTLYSKIKKYGLDK